MGIIDKQAIFYLMLVTIIVVGAVSIFIVKDFSGPLIGGGDIEIWEYAGFYMAENFRLFPIPHLNLINDLTFYPYGVNSVFQPWGFERELFFALNYNIFGIGPWVKVYYVLTFVVIIIGSFLLLYREFGTQKAILFALFVAAFNFFGMNCYPSALHNSIAHWTILSIIADFLIVRKVSNNQQLSLHFLLFRFLLLLLSLAQDLGYVAGFALLSFTITTFYILFWGFIKKKKFKNSTIKPKINIKNDFRNNKKICVLLSVCILIVAFVIVPLVLQVYYESLQFDFSTIKTSFYWAHPLRIFLPYFPSIFPNQSFYMKLIGDNAGTSGAASAGITLLILAVIGLWQSSKSKRFYICLPILTIFFLCLFHHKTYFPVLNIFPWFKFFRVAGRSTIIYPVIFCLLALNINFKMFKRNIFKIIFIAIILCAASLELYTAYSHIYLRKIPVMDKNFYKYMNFVKNQPGEAVLDWPFCVTGGNSIGWGSGLCPYLRYNSATFAYRRFHEKKVNGGYYGRLHPEQIKLFIETGWNNLFLPNEKGCNQARCFNDEEWEFFSDFYILNDFCGINLYIDLLPDSCIDEFYKRFGKPVIETVLPRVGRVKFIPKNRKLAKEINIKAGKVLKYNPCSRMFTFGDTKNSIKKRNVDFSNWIKRGVVIVPNAQIAPDHSQSVLCIGEDSRHGLHMISGHYAVKRNHKYTFSIFVNFSRYGNILPFSIFVHKNTIGTSATPGVRFNFNPGIPRKMEFGPVISGSSFIDKYPNNWYLIGFSFKSLKNSKAEIILSFHNNKNNRFYKGNLTRGLCVWGHLVEENE